ncbi:flagellar hook-length control protein FliK [bacterium]|nr:flagellar hook-length control protein FliK [bacterium]
MENSVVALLSTPAANKTLVRSGSTSVQRNADADFNGVLAREEEKVLVDNSRDEKPVEKVKTKSADKPETDGEKSDDNFTVNRSDDEETSVSGGEQAVVANVQETEPVEKQIKETNSTVAETSDSITDKLFSETADLAKAADNFKPGGGVEPALVEDASVSLTGTGVVESISSEAEGFAVDSSVVVEAEVASDVGVGVGVKVDDMVASQLQPRTKGTSDSLLKVAADVKLVSDSSFRAEKTSVDQGIRVAEELVAAEGEVDFSGVEFAAEDTESSAEFQGAEIMSSGKPVAGSPELVIQNPVVDNIRPEASIGSAKIGAVKASNIDSLSVGRLIDEIPEDVEISVKSEVVVSDDNLKRRLAYSERNTRSNQPSVSDTGTVHLQGRARESQVSLLQGETGHKGTFGPEVEPDVKPAFGESAKSVSAEHSSQFLSAQRESAGKAVQDSSGNLGKASEQVVVNADTTNQVLLKKSDSLTLSRPLPISDEHLLDQIQSGLSRQVKGQQTVTIKLWPEHLGRVDVKLVMNKQQLTATFLVEQSEVKDAMLRKIDTLRESLGLRGIDAKDIEIKVTPSKSGDGASLMADNQQHNSNSAWRQFNQGGFTNDNFGSQSGWAEDGTEGELTTAADILEGVIPQAESGINPGSLHITA